MKRRWFFISFILVLLVAVLAVHINWTWKRKLSPRGGSYFFHRVELAVPSFRQADEKWHDDPLGGIEANGTLGGEGCAVAAAAMVFKFYGVETDPQQLNWFLTSVGGYTEQGWIYWDRAAWFAPDRVRHAYEDLASYQLIDSNIARGNPVIVRVRLPSGVTHFVVIAGKDGFDYLVQDPGGGSAKGFYPLRELGSDIEGLRFYEPIAKVGSQLSVQPTVPPVTPTPQPDFTGLVDIGGRKMYLECRGTGSPIVILESGYRNDADIWSAQGEPGARMVLPGVSTITRVCAYDRPGTILDNTHFSRSNPVPMPRTAKDVVTDLHALLHAANIPGPYVLVGHSLGGLFVRLYAITYPDDVAGMVLVDAFSEWVRDGMTSDQWTLYKRFGFKDPPPGLVYKDLETVDVDISFDQMTQAKTAHPLRPIPLVVISKGLPFDLSPWQPLPADFPDALESAWKAAQEKLAALVPNTRHIVATKSSHYVQVEQPALVIEAVRQVISAVRAPSSWTVLSASPTPTP